MQRLRKNKDGDGKVDMKKEDIKNIAASAAVCAFGAAAGLVLMFMSDRKLEEKDTNGGAGTETRESFE